MNQEFLRGHGPRIGSARRWYVARFAIGDRDPPEFTADGWLAFTFTTKAAAPQKETNWLQRRRAGQL
ncbi:MAG: hypothetical protein JO051_05540 [Acidobacteriaceae bacterium]|nr:hypothetical protein [Acidobacteriaceae bacterium]